MSEENMRSLREELKQASRETGLHDEETDERLDSLSDEDLELFKTVIDAGWVPPTVVAAILRQLGFTEVSLPWSVMSGSEVNLYSVETNIESGSHVTFKVIREE